MNILKNTLETGLLPQLTKRHLNFSYWCGVVAFLGQALAGLSMIVSATLQNVSGIINIGDTAEIPENFDLLGRVCLSLSYLVSGPSCLGAAIKNKQASMYLASWFWIIMSLFMFVDLPPQLKGALMANYALFYAGFATKVHNEYEAKDGEKLEEVDLSSLASLQAIKTILSSREGLKKLGKLCGKICLAIIDDHKEVLKAVPKAVVQLIAFAKRERKEIPDFLQLTNPTSSNRRITSGLVYAGSIPLILFGENIKIITTIANFLIGMGMVTDSLGMLSIGLKKKGSLKIALILGVPLRLVGDFAQTNPFFYGLRTLGGSSFEYYFAMENKTNK